MDFKQNKRHSFTWIDYVLLVATAIASLSAGLYQALRGGKQRTTDEYLMADRKMRIFPVAVSLASSFIGGPGLLGHPAEMYFYGINYWFLFLGALCAVLLSVIFYVPLFYPLRMTSINEYLEKRFQSRAVALVGWFCQVLYQVVFIAVVLFAPSVVMEEMVGLPVWASILVIGLVATVYTAAGGLKAVIWTDLFQTIVVLGGVLVIVVKGTYLTGGPLEVWHQYSKGGKTKVDFSVSLFRRQTAWSTFFFGLCLHLTFFATSQTALQRISAVPSLQAARKAMMVTLLLYFTLQSLCCLAGVVAFSYFAKQGCEPLAAGYITGPNQIVPYFVMDVLYYPGVPGVFCACVMCGALRYLSILDSAGFGLIALALAFAFSLFGGTVMQIAILTLGATGLPLTVMFTLGSLFPRLNSKSLMTVLIAYAIMTLYFGVGGLTIKAHQNIKTDGIKGCSSVSTNLTNRTLNMTYSKDSRDTFSITTAKLDPPAGRDSIADNHNISDWTKMFQISHFWLPPITLLISSAIGICASLIPGCYMVGKRTPSLYFRCVGRCVKDNQPDGHGDEIQPLEGNEASTCIKSSGG